MGKTFETWSARFVGPQGAPVASARIAVVEPGGWPNPSLYTVAVAIAGVPGAEDLWLNPSKVVGTLEDAQRVAEGLVVARASTVRCEGWRLD